MLRLFRPRKYRGQNKRNIFVAAWSSLCLGVSSEAGGEVRFCLAVVGQGGSIIGTL